MLPLSVALYTRKSGKKMSREGNSGLVEISSIGYPDSISYTFTLSVDSEFICS